MNLFHVTTMILSQRKSSIAFRRVAPEWLFMPLQMAIELPFLRVAFEAFVALKEGGR